MNDFSDNSDNMKDKSIGSDSRYTTDKTEDTYRVEETADHAGGAYTNPDGSHGFVYNSGTDPIQKSRNRRSILIATVAVFAALILGAAGFGGAYMAARSFYPGTENPVVTEDFDTSAGIVISDDTDENAAQQTPAQPSSPVERESDTTAENFVQIGTETAPSQAAINKLSPKRTDKDGDGRPDYVYDATGNVLTSAGEDHLSVATVVARVSASVVEITTETIVQSGHIGQYITSGAGSGVIISGDGFIVTNNHVIEGANSITVRINDGKEFAATLVGTDPDTDIAVLWIDAGAYPLTVATLGASFDLVVGEDIIAIGNPLGSLGGTVTEGMISATARDINVGGADMTLLQVSAPINPGNSGGGLFNLAGELVGVVNAKMSSEEIEGLGFAIPVDTAYEVILELIEYGYVRGRPSFGATVVDVTSVQTAMRYFNSFYTGVYVYDEGHEILLYGDLIITADGYEIPDSATLTAVIKSHSVGDTLELTILRGRQEMTVTVTVREAVPTAEKPAA